MRCLSWYEPESSGISLTHGTTRVRTRLKHLMSCPTQAVCQSAFLFFSFSFFLYFELLTPLVMVISLVDAAKVKNVGKERRSVNSIHLGLLIVGVGEDADLSFLIDKFPLFTTGKKKTPRFKFCSCFLFNAFSVQAVTLWLLQHMGDLSHGS